MEKDMSLLWEVSVWEFLFVTVLLAGGAAYLTGRAVARSWESDARLAVYMVLLAAATRFLHFALFNGTLLSAQYYIVDLIVLMVIGFVGKRATRVNQMVSQYRFEYSRGSFLTWNRKS